MKTVGENRHSPGVTRTPESSSLRIQPCGCVLILDSSLSRIAQASANVVEILGQPVDEVLGSSPATILGSRVTGRIRKELTVRERLNGPTSIKRSICGKQVRLQVNAFRSGAWVMIEVEPVIALGNRRLMGTANQWLTQLAGAENPDDLMDILVRGVRDISRFDRVVVCHFDADGHGVFLAESVASGLSPMLGQRIAASDYPPQRRAGFLTRQVRSIPDVHAPAIPVISAPWLGIEDAASIKVSGTVLRAPSRMQIGYLEYFSAAALLTVAIVGPSGLWGVVTCTAERAVILSPTVRDAVRSLVIMATQRLFLLKARLESQYLLRVQESRDYLVEDLNARVSPATLLEKYGGEWLTLFRASGLAFHSGAQTETFGAVPSSDALAKLIERLTATRQRGAWCTFRLAEEKVAEGLSLGEACGLLAVALPSEDAAGWLMLFRREHSHTVYWAGRPETDIVVSAPGEGEEFRKAFDAWQEQVRGSSEPWKRVERLAAVEIAEDMALLASVSEITRLNDMLRAEQDALAAANARLHKMAIEDSLTGAWNRYRTEQEMDKQLAKASRHNCSFCVLLLDVDHFKKVNDNYGHEAGDEALKVVSDTVRAVLRTEDHFGRWGGEEFIVIATGAGRDDGYALAERVRKAIAAAPINSVPEPVTASIGVACWQKGDSRKTMVARADDAMYRAKSAGRDRVVADGELEPVLVTDAG
ncbi:diguanylate cyclase [Marinobacter lipolyticus]|nr:diguanylate cyclase [Marinobacter lipolyticus]